MKFLELVKNRRSVRKYLNKSVEMEKIERCLEAARLAPSTSNSQPWRFIIVDDPVMKEAVARETFGRLLSFNRFSLQAPLLIILISETPKISVRIGGMIKRKQFNLIDIGIAAEHFCLQAVEEGLGTCMLGWFNEKEIKRLLNVPKNKRIDLIITVGYPASEKAKPRGARRFSRSRVTIVIGEYLFWGWVISHRTNLHLLVKHKITPLIFFLIFSPLGVIINSVDLPLYADKK